MAEDGEYELLPHEEIQKLRDELNKLKKNPLGHSSEAADLQTSVSELTIAINSLVKLLSQTNDELIADFKTTSITSQFAQISAQNEQIAQGILSVAQMLQESSNPTLKKEEQSTPSFDESPTAALGFPKENSPRPSYIAPPSSEVNSYQNNMSNQNSSYSNMNNVSTQPQSVYSSMSSDNSLPDIPPMGNSSMPPPPPSEEHRYANGGQPFPGLDLPPAPEKKKGIMSMFK